MLPQPSQRIVGGSTSKLDTIYEDLRTGSLWAGYNFSAGKRLVFSLTPMIGGVLGRTNGAAPGCEASLTYKKVELSVSNEYVFNTESKSSNFYYAWPQLTYSPLNSLRIGLVAQRTKAYHTSLDTQRGFFVGISHRKLDSLSMCSMRGGPYRLLFSRRPSSFDAAGN